METRNTKRETATFERRMAIVFAAAFSTIGVFNPFFPVWLEGRGLPSQEIGFIIAAQIGLRVVASPLILKFADRAPDRAVVMGVIGIVAAILVNLFYFVSGFALILTATLALAVFWSPAVPLADSIALAGVRRLNADYGRCRLWGSLAFIIANLGAGTALSIFGSAIVPPLLTLSFAAAAVVMLNAPRLGRPRRVSALAAEAVDEPFMPTNIARRFAPRPDIRAVLPVLVAIALVQASHSAFYAFGSIVWTRLGYSGAAIGAFWAIGVTAEVVLFRNASRFSPRHGPKMFLILGAGASVIRWFAFGFEPGVWGFAALQLLHGLSFGATHLALQATIVGSVPEERFASAQGVAFALQTASISAATLLSGMIFAAYGSAMFFVMALLAMLGLILGAMSAYPQREPEGGETVARE